MVATKNAVTLLNPIDLSMVRQYPFLEEVECAAIAPNGQLFALGSKLKVKEYDKNSGNELQVHRGHHGPGMSPRLPLSFFYTPVSLLVGV